MSNKTKFGLGLISSRYIGLAFLSFLLPIVGHRVATANSKQTNLGKVDVAAFKTISLVFTSQNSEGVVLLHPGFFIDPAFDSADMQQQIALATFFNRMYKPKLLFEPTDYDLGQLYSELLKNSEWAIVPLVTSQRNQLAALRKILFEDGGMTPTEAYQRYLDLKSKYDNLKTRYDNTPPSQRTPELELELSEAREDLLFKGRENTFRPAAAGYKSLTQLASLIWRQTDLDKLQTALFTTEDGHTFYQTDTFPDIAADLTWSPLSLARTDLINPESTPRFSKGMDQDPGWFRWSLGPSPATTDIKEELPSADFNLSFEFTTLRISRNWLSSNLFDSQAWRLNQQDLISDGLDEENSGRAPAFSTGIILVRNLRIEGQAIRLLIPKLRAAIRKRQAVSFGPFRLSGNSSGTDSLFLTPSLASSVIQVSFPQIVGLVPQVLRKTPNPNAAFEWPQH